MPAPVSAAIRRAIVVTGLTAGLVLHSTGPASAGSGPEPGPEHGPEHTTHQPESTAGPTAPTAASTTSTRHCDDTRGGRLDGFAIDVVPDGVGSNVSDFDYEWEGVTFASRVWETGPADDGAYQVDLNVKVLRGERLRDLPALLDFLAYYHERDLDSWELTDYAHTDGPGYIGDGEAFWLVEPGVAVSVRLAPERFDAADLRRTADGVLALT